MYARRRRTLLIVGGSVVAALCLVAPFLVRRTVRFYSDGSGLRREVASAKPWLREVLWQDAAPLADLNDPALDEYEPCASPDGRFIIFTRGRPGGKADLWIAHRDAAGWSRVEPISTVNSSSDDMGPALARLAPGSRRLVLYFYSDRSGGEGGYDLWASEGDGEGGWLVPRNLGPQVNSAYNEFSPATTQDSSLLLFSTNRRSGGPPEPPRWVATVRETLDVAAYDVFAADRVGGSAVEFGEARYVEELSLPGSSEGSIAISPAGDFVYFASDRAGGLGGFDLYRSRRADGGLEPPENLGALVNTPGNEFDPSIGLGGFELFFARRAPGASSDDIYVSRSREVVLRQEPGDTYWSAAAVLGFFRRMVALVPPTILALILSCILCVLFAVACGRRLSRVALLTRCLLIALFVHLLAALWMNTKKVHRVLLESLGPVAEVEVFVTAVEGVAEEEISFAIRESTAETGGDESPALASAGIASPAILSERRQVRAPRGLDVRPRDLSPARGDLPTGVSAPRAVVAVTPLDFAPPATQESWLAPPAVPAVDAAHTVDARREAAPAPTEERPSVLAAEGRTAANLPQPDAVDRLSVAIDASVPREGLQAMEPAAAPFPGAPEPAPEFRGVDEARRSVASAGEDAAPSAELAEQRGVNGPAAQRIEEGVRLLQNRGDAIPKARPARSSGLALAPSSAPEAGSTPAVPLVEAEATPRSAEAAVPPALATSLPDAGGTAPDPVALTRARELAPPPSAAPQVTRSTVEVVPSVRARPGVEAETSTLGILRPDAPAGDEKAAQFESVPGGPQPETLSRLAEPSTQLAERSPQDTRVPQPDARVEPGAAVPSRASAEVPSVGALRRAENDREPSVRAVSRLPLQGVGERPSTRLPAASSAAPLPIADDSSRAPALSTEIPARTADASEPAGGIERLAARAIAGPIPAAEGAARDGAPLDLAVRREARTDAESAAALPGSALEPAPAALESRPPAAPGSAGGVRADVSREQGSLPDASASLPAGGRPDVATPAVAVSAPNAGPAAAPPSEPLEPTLATEPRGVSGAEVEVASRAALRPAAPSRAGSLEEARPSPARWSSPERVQAVAGTLESIAPPSPRGALDAPAPGLSARGDGPASASSETNAAQSSLAIAQRRDDRASPAATASTGQALAPARSAPESQAAAVPGSAADVHADLSRERGSLPDTSAVLPAGRPDVATPTVAGSAAGVGSARGAVPTATYTSSSLEPQLAAAPRGASALVVEVASRDALRPAATSAPPRARALEEAHAPPVRWSSPERTQSAAGTLERIAPPSTRSALDAPAPGLSARGDEAIRTSSENGAAESSIAMAPRRDDRVKSAASASPGRTLAPARAAPESHPAGVPGSAADARSDLSRERGLLPDASAVLPSGRPEVATPAVAGSVSRSVPGSVPGSARGAAPTALSSTSPNEPRLATAPRDVTAPVVEVASRDALRPAASSAPPRARALEGAHAPPVRWSSPERSEALARAPERIAAPTARSALDAPAPSLSARDDGPTTKSPAPPETDRGASPAPLAGGLIATRPRVVPGGSAEQIAGRAAPRAAPAAGRPDEAIAAPRMAPRSAVRAAGVEAEPAPALVAALPVGGTAEPGIRAPRERSLPRSSPGVLAAPAAAALEIGRARGPGRGDIADALIPLSSTPGSPLALPGGGRETAPVSQPSIRPSATVSAEPRRGLGGGEVASKIPLLPPPPTATAFEASTVVASETEPADAKPLTPFPIVRVRQSPRVVLELARAILPPAAAAQVAPSIAQQAVQAGERDDPLGSQSPAPAIEPSRSLGPSSAKALAEPHSTKPGSLSAVAIASSFVPKIYQLRTASRREEAIRQGGGSEETERAVALGLRWLALHQSPDGRWDLRNFMKHLSDAAERDRWHPDWDGRGRNDSRGGTSRAENGDMGATGLALLAFLGHGDTHLDAGPYQENVRRGFHFLLSHQLRDGDLRDGGNLYMHALSSFAICEAYALTRDPALEAPARRAIGFTLRTQNPDRGGWRYEPYPQSEDVDTSVFGWMLMAIKSARIAGIEIDARAVGRMERYLDSVRMTRGGGRYAYQPGLPRSSIAMTAQGFFCQQILAELKPPRTEDERTRVRRAAGESVSLLLAQRPEAADQDGANAYYWYYATLALFQEGGAPWERWNSQLKEVLLKLQLGEDQGSAAGSWDPIDRRAQLGGRVYSTAMGILCLEVYYRYAPRESGK